MDLVQEMAAIRRIICMLHWIWMSILFIGVAPRGDDPREHMFLCYWFVSGLGCSVRNTNTLTDWLQDANCGNTLLISLEELVKDGLLKEDELPEQVWGVLFVLSNSHEMNYFCNWIWNCPKSVNDSCSESERVNYTAVAELKDPLIVKVHSRCL